MKKMSETVVFFGSGPVAAESLRLLQESFSIEAVVTKPRPEHHKGAVPVIEIAQGGQIPIATVMDRKSIAALFATRPFKSRVAILVDFGIIVPQSVIDYFPLGIVNSHFSLLPEWRGADPITFAILSGQKQTGVSLMLLVAAMDEGPLLAQSIYNLPTSATTPTLTSDLIDLSYCMLQEIMPRYVAGSIVPYPQDESTKPTYSRKLAKGDAMLDWRKPAKQLEREIRAFIEWPRSKTTVGNTTLVVTGAHVATEPGTPGTRTIIDKKPAFYTSKGALVIDTLKPAGKPEMSGESFLAGYKSVFLSS